ncbi:SNAP receptor [Malassezia cuniculi]|uniref:SNAP receptor n=1 Tax=Malassezia cuniculi TaxID=948313 RepID=A0AAF0J7F1_9BASI|nr:SNAP receptor [Malassezia cuniculi]
MSFADLERGGGVEGDETPLRGALTSEPREDNAEFRRLAGQVGLHVFRIEANVSTLRQVDNRLRNATDLMHGSQADLARQFNELSEQTRGIVKQATEDFKALMAFPLPDERRISPERLTQTKLQREFQDALSAFQAVQKSGMRKEQEDLAQARSLTNSHSVWRGELPPDSHDTSTAPPAIHGTDQVQAQVQSSLSAAELEYHESLIAEREAEIREIETGVQELNEIFRDLGHIVHEQGEMIDNIEYNIGNIASNAQGADRELLQAHAYQRRAGRRALCLTMIVGLVVALVLVALLA